MRPPDEVDGGAPRGATQTGPDQGTASGNKIAEAGGKTVADAPAEPMTKAAAKKLTTDIRIHLDSISFQLDQVVEKVKRAKAGDAHLALGYRSWTEYVSTEFAGKSLRLDRQDRRGLVALLAGEGTSTRAIAPVVGVDRKTVERDISGGSDVPPDRETVGMDGKSYKKKAKPKRSKFRRPERKKFPRRYDPEGFARFEAAHGLRVTVRDVS
jgi:hypothetical protein